MLRGSCVLAGSEQTSGTWFDPEPKTVVVRPRDVACDGRPSHGPTQSDGRTSSRLSDALRRFAYPISMGHYQRSLV